MVGFFCCSFLNPHFVLFLGVDLLPTPSIPFAVSLQEDAGTGCECCYTAAAFGTRLPCSANPMRGDPTHGVNAAQQQLLCTHTGCSYSRVCSRGTAMVAHCIRAIGAAAWFEERFLFQDLFSSACLNMTKSPELGLCSACQANESTGAPEGNLRLY